MVEHLSLTKGPELSLRWVPACSIGFAGVAELADAPDLGSGAAGCMSSSLFARTTLRLILICGNSSFGRAPPCQGGGGGFEPRFPLQALEGFESFLCFCTHVQLEYADLH